jgi:hypothetical protein
MTARLAFGQPGAPLVTGWSGRPSTGQLHRAGRGHRAFRVPEAGHRRVSVPST